MLRSLIAIVATAGLLLGMIGARMPARNSNADARSEIDAFNKKFADLHLRMDTPGIMAMWAEDGVNLMQGEAPIVGRKIITAWVKNALSKNPGYKVTKEDGISRYSSVRRLGHGMGDRASGGKSAARKARFRRARKDGTGAASRAQWRVEN